MILNVRLYKAFNKILQLHRRSENPSKIEWIGREDTSGHSKKVESFRKVGWLLGSRYEKWNTPFGIIYFEPVTFDSFPSILTRRVRTNAHVNRTFRFVQCSTSI